ncbi:unnamed protein product [Effrenium voratum]|uniref:Uncharacterized protein n=1 Tax=Effrenium voratum TaxID=2562239 RepID=A0AA36MJZ8_9DINO|nr:unnamed protein product [Effrenium voratum]
MSRSASDPNLMDDTRARVRRTATPPPRPGAKREAAQLPTAEAEIQPADNSSGDEAARQAEAKPEKLQQWPFRQRGIIALALSCCALMLAMGPAAYCWLNQGRAEMADTYRGGAHFPNNKSCGLGAEATHHRPALYLGRDYVNEVASGGINGLLMMVATVVAGISIDLPGQHIFAMGGASLLAYGFSMGFGAFVVEEAKEGFAWSQMQEEYNEVRNMPSSEVDEMICHYRRRGLSEQDARTVSGILSQYEDFWVHHMMAEELGIQLPRGGSAALQSGLATGTSFLVFGIVPLLGLAVSMLLRSCLGPAWYRPQFATVMSLTLSAVALLMLGTFLSRVIGSRAPLFDGLMMCANGFAASFMAFAVGQMLVNGEGRAIVAQPKEQRRCLDTSSAGSTSVRHAHEHHADDQVQADEHVNADEHTKAWPHFRHQFFLSSSVLWVAVCSAIVAWQTANRAVIAFQRMHWEVLRVFAYGLLTCVTTGLGAVPFLVIQPGPLGMGLAVANAVAAGMMLAASGSMLFEAHEHCGPWDWQILAGLGAGALFIRASERLHGEEEEEEEGIAALHEALLERKQWRKAMLIFTVMFCHSAAEGIAVGVAFSRQLNHEFGVYISLLLAVHNVPEGLAVALVLVPRGVSATLTTFIAMLTSVPQPVLALAAFLFVEVFQGLLPLGLAFAAGAMVYVCLHELLVESVEQLGVTKATVASTLSFLTMSGCIFALQSITGV